MPWCPKCVAEYQPEIDTCVDCGTPLIDQFPGLSEQAITPQQREIALGATETLGLSLLSIGLLLGLVLLVQILPQYDPRWDDPVFGSAATICAAVGFVHGRLRQREMPLLGRVIGWSAPWFALWVFVIVTIIVAPRSCGPCMSEDIANILAFSGLWTGYWWTAPTAGVLGNLLGVQWKHRHDWARLVAFCTVLAALAYFFARMFDLTLTVT